MICLCMSETSWNLKGLIWTVTFGESNFISLEGLKMDNTIKNILEYPNF